MACHIVALEALLSEVLAITGIDLVKVNGRIRSRITEQAYNQTDTDVVIDSAAAIASPGPRQQNFAVEEGGIVRFQSCPFTTHR